MRCAQLFGAADWQVDGSEQVGGGRAHESSDPKQRISREPVAAGMIKALNRGDQTDASLLEQFGIGQLASRGVLATNHADKPEIGSDESLPSLLSLIFKKS
jgi:hypothetical protein